MIAIIDYEAGNLTSVQRALNSLGIESEISNDPLTLRKAERIIFPGVGAAGKAMGDLKRLKLDKALWEAFRTGKPILGICLGTHIIMEYSQENNTRCLGLIRGRVQRFKEDLRDDQGRKLKVPHMGWNGVSLKKKHAIFEGISRESEFYFVHAFFPCPADPRHMVGETSHGIAFTSVMAAGNLFAVQFHPEKSGRAGLRLLSNFCQWDGKDHA